MLGSYTGNSLQGQIVSATSSNGSGCLTFVFNSNSSGTGIFAGTISCYVPCTRPVAAVDIGFQPPALICPGETVNFDGSPSTSAPGTQLVSYVWDFADGTTLTTPTPQASHTFTAVGEHLVQLQVIDDNGCSSVNLTDVAVRVGTAPTFTGTQGDLVGCLGEPLCLDGVVVPTTWNELPEADFGDGVYLPDNVGDCFTSDLFFTQFAPGQTLTNINQLLTICLDIEHSFIGDLVISVTSPSGENVILHQQGGGSTFLGDANDLDNNINPVPGTCWTYCFSPTASNGTWVDNSQLGATPNVVNASQGASLAPGTYESVQSLNGLVGAQLNGTWTIEVCDLWAADNGFLCSWNIDFDPSLFPDLTEFTPVYGA
ncbi:MAG: PKD domain-containing protein, partial [Flavobacteriales bacterium]|nr:PKD domain-containing protein [Flavobacteriales bacterium]